MNRIATILLCLYLIGCSPRPPVGLYVAKVGAVELRIYLKEDGTYNSVMIKPRDSIIKEGKWKIEDNELVADTGFGTIIVDGDSLIAVKLATRLKRQ